MKSRRAQVRRIDKIFEHIGYTLLIVYALYLLCVWVSLRPSLFIHSVTIDGVHATSGQSIAEIVNRKLDTRLFFHIKRNNRLLYPKSEVEKEVLALSPRIANVRTIFDSPTQLRVVITEYTPNFLYCMRSDSMFDGASTTPIDRQPKDCYFADEEGYVYASAPEYIGYPFVAIIASNTEQAVMRQSPVGTYVLTEESYARIRTYIDNLSQVGLTTHSVTLLGGSDIRTEVGMPWVILFATDKEPARAIRNLGVVLANIEKTPNKGKDVREIDLRFGNKIFYK